MKPSTPNNLGPVATASAAPPPFGQRLATLNIPANPIYIQHRRVRLRLIPALSWGLVTVTVVGFIFALLFLTLTNRGEVDPVEAAKAALLPLIVVQGVLLMGMGTSAVATGIARERDKDLLDYHRMSPMSPSSKIVGYLFGLPAREYFLFSLTLPFVVYAVWRGGIPLLKVTHFYIAFFSSVWLYHMTGLMAGMVSRKPWQSSVISLGAVAVLYLVLPLFAQVGLSFFDFLTVRPTFYGMVADELRGNDHGDWMTESMLLTRQYEAVPFFGLRLNPTAFSLLVQGFALTTMYHVVRRKWVDISWHAFSKPFAVFFIAGLMTLLVGSLWPLLHNPEAHGALLERLHGPDSHEVLVLLIGLFFAVAALALALGVVLTTPTRQNARRGLRRARKAALNKAAWSWDAATSLPGTVVMLLIAAAGYATLIGAMQSGPLYSINAGMAKWLAVLAVLSGLVVLSIQGFLECFGKRAVVLGLFVLWVMPIMVGAVMAAAFDAEYAPLYVMSSCPVVGMLFSLSFLLDATGSGVGEIVGRPIEIHANAMVTLTLVYYAVLLVLGQALRWRMAKKLRQAEQEINAAANPESPPRLAVN